MGPGELKAMFDMEYPSLPVSEDVSRSDGMYPRPSGRGITPVQRIKKEGGLSSAEQYSLQLNH